MRLRHIALIAVLSLPLAVPLADCSTVANIATQLSSATPAQATTLAEALQAAKLATDAVDVYVRSANPNRATLAELQTLNEGLHNALVTLEMANANGQSLAMASFNAALTAFNAYSTSQGIAH